jgi:hypothetical protein
VSRKQKHSSQSKKPTAGQKQQPAPSRATASKSEVDEESDIYLNCEQYLPQVKTIPLYTDLESTVSAISSVVKGIQAISPALLAFGLPVGAAFMGAINAIGPLVIKALDYATEAINQKNKILEPINEGIELFNSRWQTSLQKPKQQYKKELAEAREKYRDALNSPGYKKAVAAASEKYLSCVTESYTKGLSDMERAIFKKLESQKLPGFSSVDPTIREIINSAIGLTISSTAEYLKYSVKEALCLEQEKLQLVTKATTLIAKYTLFDKDGSINEANLRNCDQQELTILMMAVKEAKWEQSQGVETRKFGKFDEFPLLGDMEKIRQNKDKSGFSLGKGKFADLLASDNPKAIARMIAAQGSGSDIADKLSHKGKLQNTVDILNQTPYHLWGAIDNLGNACRQRQSYGIIRRSFIDAANMVVNVFNNIVGKGVQDKSLSEALSDFRAKTSKKLVAAENKSVQTKQSALVTR